jgi:zinc protease
VFAALTSDRLKAWHRERYAPQTTILTIVGDLRQADAEKRVREALGGWPKGPYVEQLPPMPPAPPRRAHLLDRPGSVQTSLAIGAAAVDRAHPDHLPLVVANRVLGLGPTGRLFVNLRERRGLTYDARSILAAYKHGGDWRAYGDVNGERNAEAIDAFLEELQRIATEPIPTEELDGAKRSIVAGFAVGLEQLASRASNIAGRRSYGLSADYWDRYPERIMAVTAEDAQRAAAKYLDPSRLQIIAVGDASKLEPLLAAKAPVSRR